MLAAIGVSSLLRAPENLYEAANVLGHLSVGFLILLWVGFLVHAKEGSIIEKEQIVTVFLLSNLPLSLVGILLFIRPELESGWLSAIAGTLIEADAAATANNIQSIDRIGVVFMDANGASIFWGFSMWLALWRQQTVQGLQRAACLLLAIIFFTNVLATGSRAGMMALFVTAIIFIGMMLHHTRRQQGRSRYVLMALPAAAAVIVLLVAGNPTGIVGSAIGRFTLLASNNLPESDSNRIILFQHAAATIRQAPILGYGVVPFEKLGFPAGYPPHNMFLQCWIYGGVTAVSGLVLLFGAAFHQLFQQLKHSHDLWLPIVLLCWILIQSMFLNFIIGDFRIAMLLWLMVPLFLFSRRHIVDENR